MNAKRLLKLADFLDKLPRRLFDFSVITYVRYKPMSEALAVGGGCGTVGCAIGWTPAVFPRLAQWHADGVWMRRDHMRLDWSVAVDLFGINLSEALDLFSPDHSGLGEHATPKRVARHIRRFVREKQKASA